MSDGRTDGGADADVAGRRTDATRGRRGCILGQIAEWGMARMGLDKNATSRVGIEDGLTD